MFLGVPSATRKGAALGGDARLRRTIGVRAQHFEFSGLGSWCVGFLVGRSRIFSTADKWEIRDLKIDPC